LRKKGKLTGGPHPSVEEGKGGVSEPAWAGREKERLGAGPGKKKGNENRAGGEAKKRGWPTAQGGEEKEKERGKGE